MKLGKYVTKISDEPVGNLPRGSKPASSGHFSVVLFLGPLRKTNGIFTDSLTLRFVVALGQKLNALESLV